MATISEKVAREDVTEVIFESRPERSKRKSMKVPGERAFQTGDKCRKGLRWGAR